MNDITSAPEAAFVTAIGKQCAINFFAAVSDSFAKRFLAIYAIVGVIYGFDSENNLRFRKCY